MDTNAHAFWTHGHVCSNRHILPTSWASGWPGLAACRVGACTVACWQVRACLRAPALEDGWLVPPDPSPGVGCHEPERAEAASGTGAGGSGRRSDVGLDCGRAPRCVCPTVCWPRPCGASGRRSLGRMWADCRWPVLSVQVASRGSDVVWATDPAPVRGRVIAWPRAVLTEGGLPLFPSAGQVAALPGACESGERGGALDAASLARAHEACCLQPGCGALPRCRVRCRVRPVHLQGRENSWPCRPVRPRPSQTVPHA